MDEVHEETYEESNGAISQFHEQEYTEQELDSLKRRIKHYGVKTVAEESKIREQVIYRLLAGTKPHILTETRLNIALNKLEKIS